MSKHCNEVRDRLTSSDVTDLPERLAGHLEECPACARYAGRVRTARQLFRDRDAGVEPDGAFAARVMERLGHERNDVLGWAAARLLPATLALAAILAWASLRVAPNQTELTVQSPTDDLVSWAIDLSEEGS